jgi:uncharacterized phiE125 gp8 family phage protein
MRSDDAVGINWIGVTAPALEPISVDDAKTHLRITHSREDALIAANITAARQAFEQHTGRAAVTQTWQAQLSCWFEECALPMAVPLQNNALAVPSTAPVVQYYDTAGALQTAATSLYLVNTVAQPGRIERAPVQIWPVVQVDRAYPILITYVAGWSSPDVVPELVKQGIRLWVGSLDADRIGSEESAASRRAALILWNPFVIHTPDPRG